jgi:uncharacterized protein (TIGR02118 family)
MYVTLLAFEVEDGSVEDAPLHLLARIPSARLGLSGALRRLAGDGPERARGLLLAFEDVGVAAKLADGALVAGTGIVPASLHVETIDATFERPLEPRSAAQRFFALVATFDYAPGPGDAAAAERHYLEYHVPRSRELPGLRGYVTGRVVTAGTTGAPRARMGVEVFDSRDALAVSFRSPVGEEMKRDGQYVCANVRVYHLDGCVLV